MAGLFIFGYMHCGTSLLHEILVRHSSIFAKKKELKFIEYLYEIKRRFPHLSNPEQKRAYASFCASVINHSVRITKSIDEIPLGDTVVAVPSVDDHLTIFFDVFHQLSKDHKY